MPPRWRRGQGVELDRSRDLKILGSDEHPAPSEGCGCVHERVYPGGRSVEREPEHREPAACRPLRGPPPVACRQMLSERRKEYIPALVSARPRFSGQQAESGFGGFVPVFLQELSDHPPVLRG